MNKLALGRPLVGVVLLAGGPFMGLLLDGGAALGGLALGGCFLVPGAVFSEAFTGLALTTPLLEETLWERPALAKGAKAEDEAIKRARMMERRIFVASTVVNKIAKRKANKPKGRPTTLEAATCTQLVCCRYAYTCCFADI